MNKKVGADSDRFSFNLAIAEKAEWGGCALVLKKRVGGKNWRESEVVKKYNKAE